MRHIQVMFWVGVCWAVLPGTGFAESPKGILAGQGSKGPWWMQQTAMTKSGKLDLKTKPWWEQAAGLKTGQSFTVQTDTEAKGRMMVRCELAHGRGKKPAPTIVWVIDDDADGSIRSGPDKDSDCYVVDYGCDGAVDVLLDYIDNDGDNDPDEMDIRHFVDGELRYSWFGMDLDDDDSMWSLVGYEYGGPSYFEGDPYGDNMVYMNKLNTEKGTWSPISECPFAFYDTDGDGYSEVVVRCSGAPLSYDTDVDPDFANDYRRFREPWSPVLRRMGIVNIRYSFDIDGLSGKEYPLHYEMGFNLVGAAPYDFPAMHHYSPKRRPPQVTCVTPWKDLRAISDNYRAKETGFSWHENSDDTTPVGDGQHAKDDYRWEGVFWTWERRFMEHTGGPCQKWNVRREWSSKPTSRRQLYYSDVDKRIHLLGAEEGWIQIGHFSGLGPLGEIRMFDTDNNGYFDRWVYRLEGEDKTPERIVTVRDEKVRQMPWDYEKLSRLYSEELLPRAMAANRKLTAAMQKALPLQIPAELKTAMQTGPAGHRRYAQDLARELQYRNFRRHFMDKAGQVLARQEMNDLRRMSRNDRRARANSHTAWLMVRALEELDVAYGQGDFDAAGRLVAKIAKMPENWK